MQIADYLRLVLLAAIWGSSFIFMRIVAPELGPIITADLRLFIAGVFLFLIASVKKEKFDWKKNSFQFFIIGCISSAIPFALYNYAALHIPAGYSSILNAMTPMFGAVVSYFYLNEKLKLKNILGLFCGVLGVVAIAGLQSAELSKEFMLSVGACLFSTFLYGISGVYVKLKAQNLKPIVISSGSLIWASVFLLPGWSLEPIPDFPSNKVLFGLLFLAIICSAVAYLLYYRLLKDIGPTKTFTVTFIIPIFGMLWGWIFLNEPVTLNMVYGSILILIGTRLATLK